MIDNKKLFLFFILISAMTISSCQRPKQIFFTMKAIPIFWEKLCDKNEDEVKHFLKRKNYRFDYSLLSIDSLSHCHAYEKYNIQKVPESIFARSNTYSALQLRIYKSNGELYSALSQCDGDFNPIPNFINELPPIQGHNPDVNKNLLLKNEFDLVHIDPDKIQEIMLTSSRYEYVFVVYWNIWMDYFTEHLLRNVSRMKRKYPDKIMVVLINNDLDMKEEGSK